MLALPRLLEGTNLDGVALVGSLDSTGAVANERKLVVATQHAILAQEQLLNDLVAEPRYRRLTAILSDTDAVLVGIERRSCTSPSTRVRSLRRRRKFPESDHAPVVAAFEF